LSLSNTSDVLLAIPFICERGIKVIGLAKNRLPYQENTDAGIRDTDSMGTIMGTIGKIHVPCRANISIFLAF